MLTFAGVRDRNPDFLQLALVGIGRIGTNDGFMIVDIFCVLDIGQPLEGGGGPFDGASEEEVILVWGLLLPDFVLLVDDHFLLLVVV